MLFGFIAESFCFYQSMRRYFFVFKNDFAVCKIFQKYRTICIGMHP